MTKPEWLAILAWYKNIQQIENVPDANYTITMYERLRNYDARLIAYAVERLVETEECYFNKYPSLAQIIKYKPDLSYEYREIKNKADELRGLLSKKTPSTHWSFEYETKRKNYLIRYFTGKNQTTISSDELNKGVARKVIGAINDFFKDDKTPLLSKPKETK